MYRGISRTKNKANAYFYALKCGLLPDYKALAKTGVSALNANQPILHLCIVVGASPNWGGTTQDFLSWFRRSGVLARAVRSHRLG